MLGPGYPIVEQTVGTEEDSKTCPDKLVDRPPVVGPVSPSVAVVPGCTDGGSTPDCTEEEDSQRCQGKLVDGPPVMGPVTPSVAVVAGRSEGDGTPSTDKSGSGCPSVEKATEEYFKIIPAKSVDRVVQSVGPEANGEPCSSRLTGCTAE